MHFKTMEGSRRLRSSSVAAPLRPAQAVGPTVDQATSAFLVVAFLLAPAELCSLHFQEMLWKGLLLGIVIGPSTFILAIWVW